MRGVFAASITTLTFLSGPALAGVSDDLVFCSKLTNARERIACYDAAARIAAKQPSAPSPMLVTAPAADRPSAPVYQPGIERNPFQGAYVSIGGGYGFSSPRSVSLFNFLSSSLSDSLSAQGAFGTATLGYNATLGNFLFGAEISGRFGRETINTTATFPTLSTQLTGPTAYGYQLQNDVGVHIAARAGVVFDQTLVFARAGIGASHIQENGSIDTRGVTGCALFSGFPSACLIPFVGTLSVAGKTRWVPSAVFGVGAEHNFGPIFARVEGEIEALALQTTLLSGIGSSGSTSEPFWFARIMASIGVRF